VRAGEYEIRARRRTKFKKGAKAQIRDAIRRKWRMRNGTCAKDSEAAVTLPFLIL
jgi:hypothetical protein